MPVGYDGEGQKYENIMKKGIILTVSRTICSKKTSPGDIIPD